ncbi:MAG TPA: MBL fold metallo-hydrolase [Bryobacteraceae bacterium]|jgi:phosphoribosyl 1,2-cyclic phosphate phosphodiesterase|nr:MBL fold metallo-hydrolase [Bryobacteraceae bacterium]
MPDEPEPASILVLGSGTSVGVPMIGCHCSVCTSPDPRDRRLRPSVLLRFGELRILIDTSPDLRYQALRYRINRLDAILFTHGHADHILGLDDVRPFNFMQKGEIPIFASETTMGVIRQTFGYIFECKPSESTRPRLSTHVFDEAPIVAAGIEFQPIRAAHGTGIVHGFRFGNCAYLTDHSTIPPASMEKLAGLDVLFLDALRHNPHPTHSTVEESLRTVRVLQPRRAFFTHISHDLRHETLEQRLPPNVQLAYDGLEIPVGRACPA